jgi:hypothetical protein
MTAVARQMSAGYPACRQRPGRSRNIRSRPVFAATSHERPGQRPGQLQRGCPGRGHFPDRMSSCAEPAGDGRPVMPNPGTSCTSSMRDMALRAGPCSALSRRSASPAADELAARLALQMPLRGRNGQRLKVRIMRVTWCSDGDSNPWPLACHRKGRRFNRPGRPGRGYHSRLSGQWPRLAAAEKHRQRPYDTSGTVAAARDPGHGCWPRVALKPCRRGPAVIADMAAHDLCVFGPAGTPPSWSSSLLSEDSRCCSGPARDVYVHGQMTVK